MKDKNKRFKKRKLTDAEQEKEMYAICSSILAICLISLLFISGIVPSPIFKGSITGYAVFDRNLTPTIVKEETYVSYDNLSFENITQELALNAILQAEKDMLEMQEAGFGIVWVNDTLIEAKKYFEGENYTALLKQIEAIKDTEKKEKAKALLIKAQERIGIPVDYKLVLEGTKAINERKTKTYEIRDLIRASELGIKEFEREAQEKLETQRKSFVGMAFGLGTKDSEEEGLNATPLYEILSNAETEYKEERFEEAINLLTEIEPKIDEIKSENTLVKTIYRAGKETTINFIKEHYIAIIITLVIIIIIFLLSYNRIMVIILNRRIKDMDVEKDVLTELMKKAQKDRYSKGLIPKQTYEIKMAKYKERMQEIKQQMPVVQTRLDKLAKMKRIV